LSKRIGLIHHGTATGKKPPLDPPAFNYDNLVGTIWLEGNPSGYDNSHTGQIEVKEPTGLGLLGEVQGGYYDNRT